MSGFATIELDSYRYTSDTTTGGTICYVCGLQNVIEGELCQHCSAPMALTHQAEGQKHAPALLAVVGSAGVGKTVYLGMLMDMLSRSEQGLQAVARGAFSVTLQQRVIGALARCEFPDKTPNEPDRWNWIHFQLQGTKRQPPRDIIIPDLAGEAILEELDHPAAYVAITSVLRRCAGILLLVDTESIDSGSPDQEFFAMKILGHLMELDDHPKTGWRRRPVAIVFSKSAPCEPCVNQPEAYARKRLPALFQICQRQLGCHQFFSCDVVGQSAQRIDGVEGPRSVPLRIEPRGVVEPFEWLTRHTRRTKAHP